jgi:hypothetical protein
MDDDKISTQAIAVARYYFSTHFAFGLHLYQTPETMRGGSDICRVLSSSSRQSDRLTTLSVMAGSVDERLALPCIARSARL